MILTGVIFKNNTGVNCVGDQTPVIMVDGGSGLYKTVMNQCSFENNYSDDVASVAYIAGNSDRTYSFTFNHCSFQGNKSPLGYGSLIDCPFNVGTSVHFCGNKWGQNYATWPNSGAVGGNLITIGTGDFIVYDCPDHVPGWNGTAVTLPTKGLPQTPFPTPLGPTFNWKTGGKVTPSPSKKTG